MIYYCQEFKGMRIVVKPAKYELDKFGVKKKTLGTYIKFDNGKVQVKDPELIEYMEEYMKNNPGDNITAIDEKQLEKQEKIRKKVEEEMDKEEELEKVKNKAGKSDEGVSTDDFVDDDSGIFKKKKGKK